MKSPTLGVGIHEGIPAKRYHEDPCERPSLSSGIARKLLTESPAHARLAHPRLNPEAREERAHRFDIGTAAHAMLLQNMSLVGVVSYAENAKGESVGPLKNWRLKDAKQQRDAIYEAGKIPLLEHEFYGVEAIVDEARLQLKAISALGRWGSTGEPEQTIVWEEDGVLCRARPDWLDQSRKQCDDYKTTVSANPEKWQRIMYGLHGDIQVAFYLRGLKAVTGDDYTWRWIVQETAPPYALSVCSLSNFGMELANRKVESAINLWRRCIESDSWPGYPHDTFEISPSDWQLADQLSRDLNTPEAVAAAIKMGSPL